MALNEETERQFACAGYGEHNIVIYSDLYAFREIYCRFSRQALERNEIVLLATFYETVDTVRSVLSDYGIDVRRLEEQGALVLLDSMRGYQPDATGVYRLAQLLAERTKKKGKAGVFSLSDMGPFFLFQKKEELVDHESSLPKKFDIPLKGFCCYHKSDFGRLGEDQKSALGSCHHRSIRA